jgi:Zn-dependent membrane protease YugP
MHLLVPLFLVLVVVFGPGLWVKRVMVRYSTPRDRYEGSGGELARHLLDRFGLQSVGVTVAAHEVGHALQDAQDYAPLRARTRLVAVGRHAEKFGAAVLLAAPFIGILTRAPSVTGLMFLGGILSLGSAALVHLITLPTEFDASFNRALPILRKGDYLHEPDLPHARRLLKAAALTYVAASLMSLLNVARWWALLRR